MIRVAVDRKDSDDVHLETWVFHLVAQPFDHAPGSITLYSYTEWRRPSRRHNYRKRREYNRALANDHPTIARLKAAGEWLPRTEVAIPEDVLATMRERILAEVARLEVR